MSSEEVEVDENALLNVTYQLVSQVVTALANGIPELVRSDTELSKENLMVIALECFPKFKEVPVAPVKKSSGSKGPATSDDNVVRVPGIRYMHFPDDCGRCMARTRANSKNPENSHVQCEKEIEPGIFYCNAHLKGTGPANSLIDIEEKYDDPMVFYERCVQFQETGVDPEPEEEKPKKRGAAKAVPARKVAAKPVSKVAAKPVAKAGAKPAAKVAASKSIPAKITKTVPARKVVEVEEEPEEEEEEAVEEEGEIVLNPYPEDSEHFGITEEGFIAHAPTATIIGLLDRDTDKIMPLTPTQKTYWTEKDYTVDDSYSKAVGGSSIDEYDPETAAPLNPAPAAKVGAKIIKKTNVVVQEPSPPKISTPVIQTIPKSDKPRVSIPGAVRVIKTVATDSS